MAKKKLTFEESLESLEKIIAKLEGGEETLESTLKLYEEGRLKSMEFYHHGFLLDRMINHPGCFITAGTYKDIGLYSTSYRSSADYEWMKRAFDADSRIPESS